MSQLLLTWKACPSLSIIENGPDAEGLWTVVLLPLYATVENAYGSRGCGRDKARTTPLIAVSIYETKDHSYFTAVRSTLQDVFPSDKHVTRTKSKGVAYRLYIAKLRLISSPQNRCWTLTLLFTSRCQETPTPDSSTGVLPGPSIETRRLLNATRTVNPPLHILSAVRSLEREYRYCKASLSHKWRPMALTRLVTCQLPLQQLLTPSSHILLVNTIVDLC